MTEYVLNIKIGDRWTAPLATRFSKLSAARAAAKRLEIKTRIIRVSTSVVRPKDFK